jgi:chaperone modulatory protein CbpM
MARPEDHEAEILDLAQRLDFEELRAACRVEAAWLDQFRAHGGLDETGRGDRNYSAIHILRIRRALRLERDFELNMPGVTLAMDLLDEIERLRTELAQRS